MPRAAFLPPRPIPPLSEAARHRLDVVVRLVAAVAGAYVLASLTAVAVALWLPLDRVDAGVAGTLAALVVFPCAVMWCFAARTAWRAWLGLAVPVAALAVPLALRWGAA